MEPTGRLLPLSPNRRVDLEQAIFVLDGVDVYLYEIHPIWGLGHAGDIQDAEEMLLRFYRQEANGVMLFYAPHGKWFYSKRATEGALRVGEREVSSAAGSAEAPSTAGD